MTTEPANPIRSMPDLLVPGYPPPENVAVKVEAQGVLRHAAILFIVITYIWIALTALGILLMVAAYAG